MVLMLVSIQDGIESPDIFPQHLLPEIRASINDDAEAVMVYMKGGSEPVVFWISRPADIAVAPDHRNPLGCPGTQKCYYQLFRLDMRLENNSRFFSLSLPGSTSSSLNMSIKLLIFPSRV